MADIGAGTGYFSFPMAQRIPDGKVLAVDIQQEMLDIVAARKGPDRESPTSSPCLAPSMTPELDANSVDLVLIVDAYHEFEYPYEMGKAIADALRPGGALVLIEYRGEDPSVPIKPLHKMTEAQAKREMAEVGLAMGSNRGLSCRSSTSWSFASPGLKTKKILLLRNRPCRQAEKVPSFSVQANTCLVTSGD